MNPQTQTFGNVIDALADTPQEAARRCGVTQPRMNDLLRGRISRCSLDALVNMAVGCGQRVRVALEAV